MKQKLPIYLRILTAAGVLLLIYYLRNVLLPFAIAFMMAYLLNPIVIFMQKYVKKRALAVTLTLLTTAAVFAGLVYLMLPKLIHEARNLYTLLNGRQIISEWRSVFPDFAVQFIESIGNDDNLSQIINSGNISTIIEKIWPKISMVFSKTFNLMSSILGGAFLLLYLIFIMLDYDDISNGIKNMIPNRYRERSMKFFNRFTAEMQKYFRGQIIIVMIVMVLYALGFWIVDLPLGIMLGLLIGMMNIVPYLQIAGFLPALLLCFVKTMETGTPLWMVILSVAAVFVVVQILQDMIITPKIMGKTTGLNPAMILLSLSVWGKLLGFLGLIVAIPFSCLVKIYYMEYKEKTENKHTDEETDSDRRTDSLGQN